MGRFKFPTGRPRLGQPLGGCWNSADLLVPPLSLHPPPISQVRVIKRTPTHTPHTHTRTHIGP